MNLVAHYKDRIWLDVQTSSALSGAGYSSTKGRRESGSRVELRPKDLPVHRSFSCLLSAGARKKHTEPLQPID